MDMWHIIDAGVIIQSKVHMDPKHNALHVFCGKHCD